ncbi:LacI family DNA-binding transcriptional regulator [Paenibacillus sp. LX16]|nr:LacI family DNA-binding transcriptional regulator [Paenibacillus sp. LX16]
MDKKRVTLVQVAKDAGCSPATVSHFLNGNFHKMGSQTKEKNQSLDHKVRVPSEPCCEKPYYRQNAHDWARFIRQYLRRLF